MVTPCEFITQQIGKAIEYPRNKKPPRMIMGMEITSSIVHTPKAINIEKMRRKKTHRLLITKFLIISPPFFTPLYHTFANKSRQSLAYHQMMHRLRRYDAFASQIWCCFTSFRNDAMFAPKCGEATHHSAKPSSLAEPTSFAAGKHHSKKPNLSGRQIRLFCWWRQLESNQWPHACQACALTSWAMPPQRLVLYHTFFQKSIGFCKFLFFLLSLCLPPFVPYFLPNFKK